MDKSIPYADVLMRREKGTPIPTVALPEGFSFVYYRAGDEHAWARITADVDEFPSAADALLRFREEFMPFASDLESRCLFIENAEHLKIATATAWWCHTGARRDPLLHWVAVIPPYQGRGLGKAIVSRAMHRLLELEGDHDFYLHTQTWSYKAIGIYEKMGYAISNEQGVGGRANHQYDKALEILRSVRRNSG